MASFYKALLGLILLQSGLCFSQGRINMNGATMYVVNGAYVTTADLSVPSTSTVRVDSSTLVIGRNISSSANKIIMRYGTLDMTGGAAQTIPANCFQTNAVNNLIIGNSSATGISLGGAVDIYNSLTYSGVGSTLSTNDNLTIKSTAAQTAYVGDVTGNYINGKATVERYIFPHKAWRLLSVPTNTTQTIKQAWQEGAASSSSNPVAGYGTQISSNDAAWAADGFDFSSFAPSMKIYNSASNSFSGVAATTNIIKNSSGYLVFIRGDRTASTGSSPVTQTVLRSKGPLYTYDQPAITVPANQFASIGNPYASAVKMSFITKTAGVKDFFYLFDPNLAGTYGYGGYQVFSNNGSDDYIVTPGGGSYGPAGTIYDFIESGMAFMVQGGAAGGTLTFKENAKSTIDGNVERIARETSRQPLLRTTLLGVNADSSTYVSDGLMINYDDSYSDSVDDLDAVKTTNTSENLSIKNGNNLLIIERRHTIAQSDTIFLNLTGVKVQQYRFQFLAKNLSQPGLTGYVQDKYLDTNTPLNMDGTTSYDFNVVNNPGSYANNRFQIVFKLVNTLPVTFNDIKAYRQDAHINVDWKVANELNIKQYEVEKSADGNNFTTLTVVSPLNNAGRSASYSIQDASPVPGYNYYRIKSTDLNGIVSYTTIVKVLIEDNGTPLISIYPNPILNGTINLQLKNLPEGMYGIRLMNKEGQVLITKQIHHAAGTSMEQLQLDKYTPHGIYQLEVTSPSVPDKIINVIY